MFNGAPPTFAKVSRQVVYSASNEISTAGWIGESVNRSDIPSHHGRLAPSHFPGSRPGKLGAIGKPSIQTLATEDLSPSLPCSANCLTWECNQSPVSRSGDGFIFINLLPQQQLHVGHIQPAAELVPDLPEACHPLEPKRFLQRQTGGLLGASSADGMVPPRCRSWRM